MVLGCRIGAMLDEESCEIETTTFRCPMKGSPPTPIMGRRIGVMLDEESCEIEMTPF
jgi:hypothetical protein